MIYSLAITIGYADATTINSIPTAATVCSDSLCIDIKTKTYIKCTSNNLKTHI